MSEEYIDLYILAAGSNKRSDNASSIWYLPNGKSILDWQIQTFTRAFPNLNPLILVGFNYSEVIKRHPDLSFKYVNKWHTGTPFKSFFSSFLNIQRKVLITYGDTIIRHKTLIKFSSITTDVTVGVDSTWKTRFSGRPKKDLERAEIIKDENANEFEFTGLIKFSERVSNWLERYKHKLRDCKNMLELISTLQKHNFTIQYFDLVGEWAEMNEENDLAHFILGSKSETLDRISSYIKKSIILDQYPISYKFWKESKKTQISAVKKKLQSHKLIIRSSSKLEDSWDTANAGAFESVLNVDANNYSKMSRAIDSVFNSYPSCDENSVVITQAFVENVILSGVIFTCDLNTGAPYYVINFDDQSGSTDTVTAGNIGAIRTLYISKTNKSVCKHLDNRISKVISAAAELEHVLGYNKLDIEFCIDANENVLTFQVRPITINHTYNNINSNEFNQHILTAITQFDRWSICPPQCEGSRTVFSNMTDWNPAEIIGTSPNNLAKSLYAYLITDDTWAKQRAEFGYRDIRPAPLVHYFCGKPYVDCRSSINSFIPSDISKESTGRLVDAYIKILEENPNLHDKLELDIVFTIWETDFYSKAKKRLKNTKVTNNDIKNLESALKKITCNALRRLNTDIASIEKLEERYISVSQSNLPSIEKAYFLLYDCREYGTLAFAHAARAGFIAIQILRNLVDDNILTSDRMLKFQNSIQTIAGDLQQALQSKSFSLDEIVQKFGHLRPGTYDINKLSYSENPDFYFKYRSSKSKSSQKFNDFQFTKVEICGMFEYLNKLQSNVDVKTLINFLSEAIKQREKTKFIFSKTLSLAIDCIKSFGIDQLKLSRSEIGNVTVEDIIKFRTGRISFVELTSEIKTRSSHNKKLNLFRLPDLITDINSFWGYEQSLSKANFITSSVASGLLVFVDQRHKSGLNGKIVAIPSADPGFDWLFSYNIAGLITQYGGANSHMAIRCAEMNIPAAIGVGEKVYKNLTNANIILDCHNEKIEYA